MENDDHPILNRPPPGSISAEILFFTVFRLGIEPRSLDPKSKIIAIILTEQINVGGSVYKEFAVLPAGAFMKHINSQRRLPTLHYT